MMKNPKHYLALKIKLESTCHRMKRFGLTLLAKPHTNRQMLTSLITTGFNTFYFAIHYITYIIHY